MDTSQPSTSTTVTTTINKFFKYNNGEYSDGREKSIEEEEWDYKLLKKIFIEEHLVGKPSYTKFKHLIMLYHMEISQEFSECIKRSRKSFKLARAVLGNLNTFHSMFQEFKNDVLDEEIYYQVMSDILAFYIQLEMKASELNFLCAERVAGDFAILLQIFLDDQRRFKLDTILKINQTSSQFYEISDNLIGGTLRGLPSTEYSEESFLRAILVFKQWLQLAKKKPKEHFNNILKLASRLVKPPKWVVDNPSEMTKDILPFLKKSNCDITKSVLETSWSVRMKIKRFFNHTKIKELPKYKISLTSFDNCSEKTNDIDEMKPDITDLKILEEIQNDLNDIIISEQETKKNIKNEFYKDYSYSETLKEFWTVSICTQNDNSSDLLNIANNSSNSTENLAPADKRRDNENDIGGVDTSDLNGVELSDLIYIDSDILMRVDKKQNTKCSKDINNVNIESEYDYNETTAKEVITEHNNRSPSVQLCSGNDSGSDKLKRLISVRSDASFDNFFDKLHEQPQQNWHVPQLTDEEKTESSSPNKISTHQSENTLSNVRSITVPQPLPSISSQFQSRSHNRSRTPPPPYQGYSPYQISNSNIRPNSCILAKTPHKGYNIGNDKVIDPLNLSNSSRDSPISSVITPTLNIGSNISPSENQIHLRPWEVSEKTTSEEGLYSLEQLNENSLSIRQSKNIKDKVPVFNNRSLQNSITPVINSLSPGCSEHCDVPPQGRFASPQIFLYKDRFLQENRLNHLMSQSLIRPTIYNIPPTTDALNSSSHLFHHVQYPFTKNVDTAQSNTQKSRRGRGRGRGRYSNATPPSDTNTRLPPYSSIRQNVSNDSHSISSFSERNYGVNYFNNHDYLASLSPSTNFYPCSNVAGRSTCHLDFEIAVTTLTQPNNLGCIEYKFEKMPIPVEMIVSFLTYNDTFFASGIADLISEANVNFKNECNTLPPQLLKVNNSNEVNGKNNFISYQSKVHETNVQKHYYIYMSQEKLRLSEYKGNFEEDIAFKNDLIGKCFCLQCIVNSAIIYVNQQILKAYWQHQFTKYMCLMEKKVLDETFKRKANETKEDSPTASKKRKMDKPKKIPVGPIEDSDISYPSTPMISIAELEILDTNRLFSNNSYVSDIENSPSVVHSLNETITNDRSPLNLVFEKNQRKQNVDLEVCCSVVSLEDISGKTSNNIDSSSRKEIIKKPSAPKKRGRLTKNNKKKL